MRAIVVDRFGGPEVLRERTIDRPPMGPHDIQVQIVATSANPVDASNRSSGDWARLTPPVIVGYDVAGVVAKVGEGVDTFAVGQEVMYMLDFLGNPWGSYAEISSVGAQHVVDKPAGLTFNEAAALPLAGGTALEVIDRRLQVRADEWVVIHGAAGGVGSFAVQIAVARGARVIAVSSRRHHDWLKSFGVAECVDYQTQDPFTLPVEIAGGEVDAVADLVGGTTASRSLAMLREGGRVAVILDPPEGDLLLVDKNQTLHGILVRPDATLLGELLKMIADGSVRPVIDQVTSLQEVEAVHRRLESGHGRGKVVLEMTLGAS